jgi:hypothetical protein
MIWGEEKVDHAVCKYCQEAQILINSSSNFSLL